MADRLFISHTTDILVNNVAQKLRFPANADGVLITGLRLMTGISSLEEVTAVVVESAFMRLLLLDSQGNRPLYSLEVLGYGTISDGASQLSMIQGGAYAQLNEVMDAEDCYLKLYSNIPVGLQADVIVEYTMQNLSDLKAAQLAWGA